MKTDLRGGEHYITHAAAPVHAFNAMLRTFECKYGDIRASKPESAYAVLAPYDEWRAFFLKAANARVHITEDKLGLRSVDLYPVRVAEAVEHVESNCGVETSDLAVPAKYFPEYQRYKPVDWRLDEGLRETCPPPSPEERAADVIIKTVSLAILGIFAFGF